MNLSFIQSCGIPGLLAGTLVATSCAGATWTEAISTTAQIVVTVQDSAGLPMANIPLNFRSSVQNGSANSGGSGTVTLNCQIGNNDAEIIVTVASEAQAPGDLAAWRASVAAYRQLVSNHAFNRHYIVPIVQGQANYTLTLVGRPAITATGRVLDAQENPIPSTIIHAGQIWPASTADDGGFSIGGIAKGVASEVFVVTEDGSIVPVTVPASQADVNLGTISVPARPVSQGSLRITIGAWTTETPRREGLNSGVTLISADGGRIFTLSSRADGAIRQKAGSDELPQVPAGVYLIAPGVFTATEPQLRLLRAVRGQVDFTGSSIATLTVNAGAECSLAVDLAAMTSAITALPQ